MPSGDLTWRYECPLVTVVGPQSLGLMARQWPGILKPERRGDSMLTEAGGCFANPTSGLIVSA